MTSVFERLTAPVLVLNESTPVLLKVTLAVSAPPPDNPVPANTLTVLGTAPETAPTLIAIAALAAAVS